ncbi:hypothetical protein Mycch_4766 [Mycolicibacterium chubuense NBB4]|uniref:Uncharacterized protein n=1 Tax=Mycolicibacterium chubuense (strain NBB4) TaxID=710421 RepID=I4BQA7_MYCCN|nr:hypothetical protein [Mycolicibacterium chubuense]AFM19464.1 hypothetical protein Mycch_4766 [Mycolicibacterium chubuense NBB4]
MIRPIPAAYAGAIDVPCPTCSAEPGAFCLVEDGRRGPRRRRVPCVRRCPPGPPDVEHQAPAYPTRSFSEPIHPHETQE